MIKFWAVKSCVCFFGTNLTFDISSYWLKADYWEDLDYQHSGFYEYTLEFLVFVMVINMCYIDYGKMLFALEMVST